jgi:hypothetical protein
VSANESPSRRPETSCDQAALAQDENVQITSHWVAHTSELHYEELLRLLFQPMSVQPAKMGP